MAAARQHHAILAIITILAILAILAIITILSLSSAALTWVSAACGRWTLVQPAQCRSGPMHFGVEWNKVSCLRPEYYSTLQIFPILRKSVFTDLILCILEMSLERPSGCLY